MEHFAKKPLKRPAFSKGYAKNERNQNSTVPIQKSVVTSLPLCRTILQQSNVVPKNVASRNKPKFVPVAKPQPRFGSTKVAQPIPPCRVKSEVPRNHDYGQKPKSNNVQSSKKSHIPLSLSAKKTEINKPFAGIGIESWRMIQEWCALNRENVSDFCCFSSSFNEGNIRNNVSRSANSVEVEVNRRLEKLYAHLVNKSFSSSILFEWLKNQCDTFNRLKEYSLFWVILAECKTEERLYFDVRRILMEAFEAKPKSPGRLIEAYKRFVDVLFKEFGISSYIAPELNTFSDSSITKREGDANSVENLKISVVEDDSADKSLNEIRFNDDPSACVLKEVESADNEIVDVEQTPLSLNTVSVIDINFDTEDLTVLEVANVEEVESSDGLRVEQAVKDLMDFGSLDTSNAGGDGIENENKENILEVEQSRGQLGDRLAASAKGARRRNSGDILDPNQIFLSSQNKFALFTDKSIEAVQTPGNMFLTPVRRSTRVDQNDLPSYLQEKLTLYDSPSECNGENWTVVQNARKKSLAVAKVVTDSDKHGLHQSKHSEK